MDAAIISDHSLKDDDVIYMTFGNGKECVIMFHCATISHVTVLLQHYFYALLNIVIVVLHRALMRTEAIEVQDLEAAAEENSS